jgi:hypothetical protein
VPDGSDSKHFDFYPISAKPGAVHMCESRWHRRAFPIRSFHGYEKRTPKLDVADWSLAKLDYEG